MSVQAECGVVGEVRAEREEERPKVPVHGIEIILVHQGRRLHQPGIGLTGLGVAAPLCPPHHGFLLGLPNEEHALLPLECGEVLVGDLVLALPVGEGEQRHTLRLSEAFQGFDEGGRERFHQRGRGKGRAMMFPEEADHAQHALQLGDIDVEVETVDTFHFQADALPENMRHRLCAAHRPPLLVCSSSELCDRCTDPSGHGVPYASCFRNQTRSRDPPMSRRSEAEPR